MYFYENNDGPKQLHVQKKKSNTQEEGTTVRGRSDTAREDRGHGRSAAAEPRNVAHMQNLKYVVPVL